MSPRTLQIAVLLFTTPLAAQEWKPPLGIPNPDFGISESHQDYGSQSYDFGSGPEPYRDAGNGPYTHYVDNSDANCSDDVSGLFNFGTPAKPRCTIPGRDGDPLAAGSVVEVHGVYDYPHSSPRDLHGAGTAERPIFIRGPNVQQKTVVIREMEIVGSSYVIVENFDMKDADGDLADGYVGMLTVTDKGLNEYDSDHIVVRHNKVHGNLQGGGLGVASYNPDSELSHVVLYNNVIHDVGDVDADFDQDKHCIAIGAGVRYLWVVDNHMARCSGDGLQVNAGTARQADTHHLYIGRNTSHGHKQTGLWTKQAVDVIFSQNHIFNIRPSNSSLAGCMGQQYGPEYVWYLFNELHDCESGIRFESDGGGFGTHAYIVGNLIYDINSSQSWDAGNAHDSAAIVLRGGVNRRVVHNTLWSYQAGLHSPSIPGSIEIHSNIFGGRTTAEGRDILFEMSSLAAASQVHHNLFADADVRIQWADGMIRDLASFQAATGKGQSSFIGQPRFVDAPAGDLRLARGSPAIDAGAADSVYSLFNSRYGIDLARDAFGGSRPIGAHWDIGAHEFGRDIFADGFESGTALGWSRAVALAR